MKMSKVGIDMLSNKRIAWKCDPCASSQRHSMRLERQADQSKLTLQYVMQATNATRDDQIVMVYKFNKLYEALNDKLNESVTTLKSLKAIVIEQNTSRLKTRS